MIPSIEPVRVYRYAPGDGLVEIYRYATIDEHGAIGNERDSVVTAREDQAASTARCAIICRTYLLTEEALVEWMGPEHEWPPTGAAQRAAGRVFIRGTHAPDERPSETSDRRRRRGSKT